MKVNCVSRLGGCNSHQNRAVKQNFKAHPIGTPALVTKSTAQVAGFGITGALLLGAILAAGIAIAKNTDNYINKNYTDKEKEDFIDQRIKSDNMFG